MVECMPAQPGGCMYVPAHAWEWYELLGNTLFLIAVSIASFIREFIVPTRFSIDLLQELLANLSCDVFEGTEQMVLSI